jgi:hypothetical protein
MELATGVVLAAGTMTFANEWWQTKQVNWRVPVATLLLGAAFDFFSKLDSGISNMLAAMVFIGAGTTTFNGKSAFDTLAGVFPARAAHPAAQTQRRVQVV